MRCDVGIFFLAPPAAGAGPSCGQNIQRPQESLVTRRRPRPRRGSAAPVLPVALMQDNSEEKVQDVDGSVDVAVPEVSIAVAVEAALQPKAVLELVQSFLAPSTELRSVKLVDENDCGAPLEVLHPSLGHDGGHALEVWGGRKCRGAHIHVATTGA